jgi:Ni/Fe-hydrogenase subunit HybB-like protein
MEWLKIHSKWLYVYSMAVVTFLYEPNCVLSEERDWFPTRLFIRISSPILALAFVALVIKNKS